jgi:hypothetical protein
MRSPCCLSEYPSISVHPAVNPRKSSWCLSLCAEYYSFYFDGSIGNSAGFEIVFGKSSKVNCFPCVSLNSPWEICTTQQCAVMTSTSRGVHVE